MLASDLNNPEFVNPLDPDSMLQVEFYDHEALDPWETEKTGIKTYRKACPFIQIAIPGNDKSVVNRPADNNDVKKYHRQWLIYQMQTGKIANAENVPGWQLDDWPELEKEQIRSLKFLRFYTVEQIAGASDVQIQGIGMGGMGLREKARKAVAERNGAAVNTAVAERDAKIAELEAKMERMMALLERGPQTIPGHLSDARPDEEAPKRGRPAKVAA